MREKWERLLFFGILWTKTSSHFQKYFPICSESKLEVCHTETQQILTEAQQIVDLNEVLSVFEDLLGNLEMSITPWSLWTMQKHHFSLFKLDSKADGPEAQRKEKWGRQTHISLTITPVKKRKEVIVLGSMVNKKCLWFSKIHLHLVINIFWKWW